MVNSVPLDFYLIKSKSEIIVKASDEPTSRNLLNMRSFRLLIVKTSDRNEYNLRVKTFSVSYFSPDPNSSDVFVPFGIKQIPINTTLKILLPSLRRKLQTLHVLSKQPKSYSINNLFHRMSDSIELEWRWEELQSLLHSRKFLRFVHSIRNSAIARWLCVSGALPKNIKGNFFFQLKFALIVVVSIIPSIDIIFTLYTIKKFDLSFSTLAFLSPKLEMT